MRICLWISTERSFDEVAASGIEAERLGFDGIYVADHFMPQSAPLDPPRLEAWTTLGALAALTSRVRLGALVTGNTYRHPAILAKMAATLDHVSDGRAVLGLGAGWQMNEHRAYGISFPEIPERLGRLEEASQVVRMLLEQPRSNFDGRWYHLEDAPCEPKPVQSHLPLLLGVAGERVAMGIAARWADIWNYWATPSELARKLEVLDRHCVDAGRDPATLERSTQALVLLDEEDRRSPSRAQPEVRQPAISGTPGRLSETLGKYAELGVDEFVLSDRTLGESRAERFEHFEQFLNDIAAPHRG